MDLLSLFFLIVLAIGGLCMFVGFMMGVWYFNCEYIFPLFQKVSPEKISPDAFLGKIFDNTISLTFFLNEKLKPLASFWLIGISLAAIFIVLGIVYGSNMIGTSTASVTATSVCIPPVPEKRPKKVAPQTGTNSPGEARGQSDQIEHVPD